MMSHTLSILRVLHDTTVDGPGFRTSIYAAGCPHACPGCHNPESWAREGGRQRTLDDLLQEVLSDEFAHVTFSGGDPLFQVQGFALLAAAIKRESGKNIWCYTGYTFEQVAGSKNLSVILPHIDVLVDGRFVLPERNTDLLYRGSNNQRLVDVPASLKAGALRLWDSTHLMIPTGNRGEAK